MTHSGATVRVRNVGDKRGIGPFILATAKNFPRIRSKTQWANHISSEIVRRQKNGYARDFGTKHDSNVGNKQNARLPR